MPKRSKNIWPTSGVNGLSKESEAKGVLGVSVLERDLIVQEGLGLQDHFSVVAVLLIGIRVTGLVFKTALVVVRIGVGHLSKVDGRFKHDFVRST